MSDPRACEGCGLISATAEYILVRVTNGALRLCRQRLDDRWPWLTVRSAATTQWRKRRNNVQSNC